MRRRRCGLDPIPFEKRIYFDVPYMARDAAKHCFRMRWDPDRKRWYTGPRNPWLDHARKMYRVVDVEE